MLWQGVLIVAGAYAAVLVIAAAPDVARWTKDGGWQYWMCLGLALVLSFTGVVDAKRGIEMVIYGFCEVWYGCFHLLDESAKGVGFPAVLIYWVLTMIWCVIGLVFVVIMSPVLLLDWLAGKAGVFLYTEKVLYAALFALTLRWLIFPVLVVGVRRIWPMAAGVIHDVFIAVPSEAAEELRREGQVTVRIRSKVELALGIFAAVMAVLAHFWRGVG